MGAGEFGLEPMDELTLVVQLAQFGSGSKPKERNKITFNSRNYRIETIEKAPQEYSILVEQFLKRLSDSRNRR